MVHQGMHFSLVSPKTKGAFQLEVPAWDFSAAEGFNLPRVAIAIHFSSWEFGIFILRASQRNPISGV
jgi:hypothetical protein